MSGEEHSPGPGPMSGKLIRAGLIAFYSFLIIRGRFDAFQSFGVLQYSLIALLLLLVLFEVVQTMERGQEMRLLALGVWILIALRVALQATGFLHSPLYPLAYLFFAVLVSVLGARSGVALWSLFMGLEAGRVLAAGPLEWGLVVQHGAYLFLFGAVVGGFVHVERRVRRKAQGVLKKLYTDVSEFTRDDTVQRLGGLNEGMREKHSVRSVLALDRAFEQALQSGRELLGAETCGLYWRSSLEEPYRLREVVSSRECVDPSSMVASGKGLLGKVAESATAMRASGKRLRGAIPHYQSWVRPGHFLALPVRVGEEVHGILCFDRDIERFSRGEEKLAFVIASQVSEVHENALLVRRIESEASGFKSLAELGHRLSRSLELAAMLDDVVRTSKAIAGYHAGAVVLSTDKEENGEARVTRAEGEMPRAAQDRPVEPGSLVELSMARGRGHYVPDLSGRERKTAVAGNKLDPPGMRSALIQPLSLGQRAKGALVFYSREPQGFSDYVIKAVGILADMAAVSIQNALLYQEMEHKAVTDGLTGLHNHRWFQEELELEIERAQRLGHKVGLVICDIDLFKRVNDRFGHQVGDEVLKAVARTLTGSIRKVDSAARYGGEEFVLVLPGAGRRGARELAERVRRKVSRLLVNAGGREFRVSVSAGVAVFPEDANSREDLVRAADQALYLAKESGRNKVVEARQLRAA